MQYYIPKQRKIKCIALDYYIIYFYFAFRREQIGVIMIVYNNRMTIIIIWIGLSQWVS